MLGAKSLSNELHGIDQLLLQHVELLEAKAMHHG